MFPENVDFCSTPTRLQGLYEAVTVAYWSLQLIWQAFLLTACPATAKAERLETIVRDM